MNRHLLSLALATAALATTPLAFAQDAHANANAQVHASDQAMQQHMGTQDSATATMPATPATPAIPATPADPQQEVPATPATPAVPATPATPADAKKVTWSELDIDHDGMLSKAEAGSVDSLASAFDAADADKDGSLTADEYKAYLATRQQSPSPASDDDDGQ